MKLLHSIYIILCSPLGKCLIRLTVCSTSWECTVFHCNFYALHFFLKLKADAGQKDGWPASTVRHLAGPVVEHWL